MTSVLNAVWEVMVLIVPSVFFFFFFRPISNIIHLHYFVSVCI